MSNASLELGGDNWAAKDGNLLGYAVGDSSGEYVPREFTFTRGSNLAATRVAANGLIEKGRENLLTQSNSFDNAIWIGRSQTTLTEGQSGYDGSNDAWSCLNTSGGQIMGQSKVNQGVQTISVYAKGSVSNGLRIFAFGNDNVDFWFNLNTGLPDGGISSKVIDYNIEDVNGDGEWYRCSFTFSQTTNSIYFYCTDNNRSNASGTIYLQDAQLEQGLAATDYIETGATTVQAGLLEDEPRIDYTGGTGSLLLEPQRSNLITQSEYFGGYNNSNSTDETNATTSPEGLTNATSFLEASTTGQHKLATSYGFDGSSTYTFSVFAKYNGRDLFVDTQNSNEWGGRAWFDLTNGTANAVLGTADIENFGNGWYRCSVTGASTLAGGNQIELLTSDGATNSTTGDITKGVYIYGAQLEEGSYPTSYIPNHSGGSVTRVAEGQTYSGFSSLIGQTEGTLFLEIDNSSNNTEIFSLNRSTANAIFLRAVSNVYGVYIYADGATYIVNTSISINDKIKIAIAYESGNFAIYANGSQVSTNNSNWTPNVLIDTLNFNVGGYISSKGKVNFNKVLLFPTALSDAQCSALTVEGLKEEILTSYIAAVDTLEDGAEARLDTYLQNLEELIV